MSSDMNKKTQLIKEFQQTDNDTGSVRVQIALLTDKIKEVSAHMEKNPKDVSSKRGLLQAVAKRRTFLGYLKKHDLVQYKEVVNRLGLRK